MTDEEMKRLEEEAREGLKMIGETYGDHMVRGLSEGVLSISERVRKAEAKVVELAAFAENFATAAEAAITAYRAPKTGMQVPFFGDFAGAGPSVIGRLEWWAKRAREALGDRRTFEDMLRAAERKGAEEMRERAATVHDGQCASQGFSGLSTAPWHRRYAAEIRGLPLPGDPP